MPRRGAGPRSRPLTCWSSRCARRRAWARVMNSRPKSWTPATAMPGPGSRPPASESSARSRRRAGGVARSRWQRWTSSRASGASSRRRADQRAEVVLEQPAALLEDERLAVEEVLGLEQQAGEPARPLGREVADVQPPGRAVADRLADRPLGLRRHDDRHVPDPGRGHGLQTVEQDRPVGHRQQLARPHAVERGLGRPPPAVARGRRP